MSNNRYKIQTKKRGYKTPSEYSCKLYANAVLVLYENLQSLVPQRFQPKNCILPWQMNKILIIVITSHMMVFLGFLQVFITFDIHILAYLGTVWLVNAVRIAVNSIIVQHTKNDPHQFLGEGHHFKLTYRFQNQL